MKYIKNIDTICILVDILDYEKDAERILTILDNEKNNAKSIDDMNYKHIINIGNLSFQIFNVGTKGYSYILHNDGYQINIAQYRSKIQSFYPIQVRISSEYLWSIGIIKAWSLIYDWIENNFGKIKDTKVYRIDLCLHTSDVDFITNYEKVYKGKYKKYTTTFNGLKINSICFGTRKGKNIYCRIYDKTLEIRETKSKSWFNEIWRKNGIDIENVWNLEFEIKSEFLRELKLNTIEEVCSCLPNLWRYCTEEWLVKIDRTNARVERCNINSSWIIIQKAYDEFHSKGYIPRQKQISMDAEVLLPNIVGSITSYSARINNVNMQTVFKQLYKDILKYMERKEKDFGKEVNSKIKILREERRKNI